MRRTTLKTLALAVFSGALILAFLTPALALDIRGPGGGGGGRVEYPSDNDFTVRFEPVKDVYRTGEKIQFKFRSERSCYLYLFSISENEGRGYQLLPNRLQSSNRYQANRWYTVPGGNLEFYSSNPGVERVFMVASVKPLRLRTSRYSKSGSVYWADSGVVEDEIKSLRIRSRSSGARAYREVSLVVIGPGDDEPGPSPIPLPPSSDVSAFVSSDKTQYQVGDTMRITFGADKSGYIYLYVVEPDGDSTYLKRQHVNGNRFYRLNARVVRPTGRHRLVAVYNRQGNFNYKAFRPGSNKNILKGIRIVDDETPPYATYEFHVYR